MKSEPEGRLDLGLKVAELKAKQGRPAQPAGPRRTRTPNPDAPPPPPDAAERAAHDYDPDDVDPTPRPAAGTDPATVPAHLQQYLVRKPLPTGSRLERAQQAPQAYAGAYRQAVEADERAKRPVDERAARAAGEAARADAWAFGYLGCDWAGLYRLADARRRAGLPLDDLDDEALARGDNLNQPAPPADT